MNTSPIVDVETVEADIAAWRGARNDFAKQFSENCDLDADTLKNEALNACILQSEVIISSLMNMLSLVKLANFHSRRV